MASEGKLDWILFAALAVSLAWAPLPFGSSFPLAWGINAVLFASLVLIYEITLLAGGKSHPFALNRLKLSATLFLVVVLWIFLQCATWTPTFTHHPIWKLAGEALERPVPGSISVNRELTFYALTRLLTTVAVFWLAIQLCRNGPRAVALINILAVIISAYAAYGLISAVVSPGHVLWLEILPERHFVTSTFLNRNTFATYAGMGFVLCCGLFLEHGRDAGSLLGRLPRDDGKSYLCVAGAGLNLVCLLLTGSRGATLATGLALVVLVALTLGRRWNRARFATVFAIGGLAATTLFVGLGAKFFESFAQRGFYDENRVAVYRIVIRSILDNPWLGYGYGAFSDIFPLLRDRSIEGFGRWEMAHNLYLEVVQGLGVVFGLMLMVAVALLVWRCFAGAVTRQQDAIVPATAAAVSVLVGVHALVDYSLQIQAITLTFAALLGAGVAQSESSRLILNDEHE